MLSERPRVFLFNQNIMNLLQHIGNTPFVKLNNLIPNRNVNLFAKLEGQNPGGSIKDRAALYMIEQAEKYGKLTKDQTILEATSGNMGIALAMVGASKGYKVTILMSKAMSEERKVMLRSLGAKLILTNPKFGTEGAIKAARELVRKNPGRYWFANQFNNSDNTAAHYHGIAKELLKDHPQIDYLFIGVGTSGTVMGIAKRFKIESPRTKIMSVVPPPGYKIQGIQHPEHDFSGKIFNRTFVDEEFEVDVDEAYAMAVKAAQKEGLFVGMSAGAALLAAIKTARKIKKGNLAVIIPDRGEKYLSTALFT